MTFGTFLRLDADRGEPEPPRSSRHGQAAPTMTESIDTHAHLFSDAEVLGPLPSML
jgi:hypothetical protein